MSIHVTKAVWVSGPTKHKERILLLAIADHADLTGMAFPGIALLAAKTCMSERSVIRLLSSLKDGQWIEIQTKSAGPQRKGNTYIINLRKLSVGLGDARRLPWIGELDLCLLDEVTSELPEKDLSHRSDSSQMTLRQTQVTKLPASGDKSKKDIRKNHHEPSFKPPGEGPRLTDRVSLSLDDCVERLLLRMRVVTTSNMRNGARQTIQFLASSEDCNYSKASEILALRAASAES